MSEESNNSSRLRIFLRMSFVYIIMGIPIVFILSSIDYIILFHDGINFIEQWVPRIDYIAL